MFLYRRSQRRKPITTAKKPIAISDVIASGDMPRMTETVGTKR
jgi:hypothetical protein